MWILVLWLAHSNPPVVDFGYFWTHNDCNQMADQLMKDHESKRDAFCILGAEEWKAPIINIICDEQGCKRTIKRPQ